MGNNAQEMVAYCLSFIFSIEVYMDSRVYWKELLNVDKILVKEKTVCYYYMLLLNSAGILSIYIGNLLKWSAA